MSQVQTQCSTCKGKGTLLISFRRVNIGGIVGNDEPAQPGKPTSCYRCDGRGHTPKVFLEDQISWCRCSEQEQTFGGYPQGPHGACRIPKEHVHCGTCGLVSQLG